MQESKTKEKVLKKVRKALINRSETPYPIIDWESNVYQHQDEIIEIVFAQQLSATGGSFFFCVNELEFTASILDLAVERGWRKFFCKETSIIKHLDIIDFPYTSEDNELLKAEVALINCECLVARTGSIMVTSKQLSGRKLPITAPILVVLAYTSQLVEDMKTALSNVKKKYTDGMPSMINFISGPSRTNNIGGEMVIGVHGPAEVIVFLIDDTATESLNKE